MRSSTRAAAPLIEGASAGCTQPASAIRRRVWRAGGRGGGSRRGGILARNGAGTSGRSARPSASSAEKSARRGKKKAERRAPHAIPGAAARSRGEQAAADVQEPAVLDTGGTGGLAGAAGEAAVEVKPRMRARHRAFHHSLDEVDSTARPVELVAEELVGGTGGGAEAAVHALAEDLGGFLPLGRVADEVGELGLHVRGRGTCGRG